MNVTKKMGVWMDHSSANFIDLTTKKNSYTIISQFTTDAKDEAITKNEHLMHVKEQTLNKAYYKEIAAEIEGYDRVLLFGPTDAKTELYNYLNSDLHFKDIQFDVVPAEKMTTNEKEAFVKRHFKN